MSAQRLFVVTALVSPLLLACADDGDPGQQPMFTSGDATQGGDGDGDASETGGDMSGDGDGDSGDGDGDSGDGDGDSGDGDGDSGDGDGDSGDGDPGGCETEPGAAGTSCGQDAALKGAVAIGESIADMPIGTIHKTDNGQGNGFEDWYRIDFPLDANNPRPVAGMTNISFALNEGGDYRFEVYRDCGAEAYGQGLASEFGSNAPPLLEWTFNDLDAGGLEQAEYLEMVPWPTTVWVRVFRFQNDEDCSSYQLQVSRN